MSESCKLTRDKHGIWKFQDQRFGDSWVQVTDEDWLRLGKRNCRAILEEQKQEWNEAKNEQRESGKILSRFARVRKVTSENPDLLRWMSDLMEFVHEEKVEDFEYLRRMLEGKDSVGLEDAYNYCEERLHEIDDMIKGLETIIGRLSKVETKNSPPVLPCWRQEKMFNEGDRVVVWLRSTPCDYDQPVYSGPYPYLTKVMSVHSGVVHVESRYADEELPIYSLRIMTKYEFEYYRDHPDYRNFLIAKARKLEIFCRELEAVENLSIQP